MEARLRTFLLRQKNASLRLSSINPWAFSPPWNASRNKLPPQNYTNTSKE